MKDLLPGWLHGPAPEGDVVVSSRIRLARNLQGYSFPHQADEEALETVIAKVENALEKTAFTMKRLDGLTQADRLLLVEQYLISPDLLKNPSHRGVMVNPEQTVAIMLNEEDHIRIQSILPGLALQEAWAEANRVDDLLEAELDYAFAEKAGYLTTCPTNVGTGLRASVMLHLPALQMVDQVKKVLSVLPHVGLSVRGIYGEGTESAGNLYQISNQVTLGLTEDEIIGKIISVTKQVMDQERSAREALLAKESRLQLEDRVHRAYGLLSEARLISSEEAFKLWNNVLLGVKLDLIPEVSVEQVNELFFLIRPAILQHIVGKDLTPHERDYYRAEVIRKHLKTKRE
ncbi:MAG: protein arginine kinase [Firmicutes bacterium]|nr:protein arginine kinase [Bacillota bacterium]